MNFFYRQTPFPYVKIDIENIGKTWVVYDKMKPRGDDNHAIRLDRKNELRN